MSRAASHPRQPKLLRDSIKKLTAFHAVGKEALRLWSQAPGINAYGVVAQHSQRLKCSTSRVFSARSFAEAVDDAELRRFCKFMTRHGQHVTMCHVRALATVPDPGVRWELAQRLAEGGWSLRHLMWEIQKEYPRRGRGGRAYKVPADPVVLMHRMRDMCEKWQRFAKRLNAESTAHPNAPITKLSAEVIQAHKCALRAVDRLEKAIQAELPPDE